ncbi:Na/Pi symporter, partial [Vibrio sp. FNV 38]|nr:Na/Pi symporter [Vibrio sp. FNV 38]
MLLTMVVQATSATFAIALLMCVNQWISFEMGCALVLGSNIGTCLTPMLASLSANTMAKRAALGHLLFNVLGMVWALAIFYYLCDAISYLCSHIGLGDPHEVDNVAMGLAMFHTVFNFISLCLMLPLTTQIARLLT